jgi:DNA helicase II / ATP-dependent DNA helicase PcrA
LERLHEDARTRELDLLQLAQIASTYPNRQRFLTVLTLDPPNSTSDDAGAPLLDEDYLILSTIHSANGQEWKSVFVLNCVDGCIPSDLATESTPEIEEERRLRRHDSSERSSSDDQPAAVLRASAHKVHSEHDQRPFRAMCLAAGSPPKRSSQVTLV